MLDSGLARARPPRHRPRRHRRSVTTGDVNWFEELGRRLLGPELERAEHLDWDRSDGGAALPRAAIA